MQLKVRVTYMLNPPLRVVSGVEVVAAIGSVAIHAHEGLATYLSVAIHDPTGNLNPRVTPNPSAEVKLNVDIPAEIHTRTLSIARTFVATLGMRGADTKVVAFPSKYEWEPDLDGESMPSISEWRINRERREGSHVARLDEIIHSVVSVGRMMRWVEVIEFHNAGVENFLAERYADSLRYNFFVIESLFGAGRTNPKKLVAEFKQHLRLAVATRSALRFPRLFVKGQLELDQYRLQYAALKWQDALLHLAVTRGSISHHNGDSPKRWTVAHQQQFQLDATLMVNIAQRIVWKIARHEMWSPEVVAACGGYANEKQA